MKIDSDFKLTKNEKVRIIKKLDSFGKKHSYTNTLKSENMAQIKKTMNGMEKISDLCYLKIKGVSQLNKEIAETKNIQNKFNDQMALHRNEMTDEIEGAESFDD